LYASILKSRAVCQGVVDANDLKEVYNAQLDQEAIDVLLGRTTVMVQPDGIISLGYEDTDPERAAVITQSFIDELNTVNQENLVSKARSLREFVEQRLSETIRDLANAEEAYKNFQETHFTVSLDDQMKAVISAIADLRGQLAVAEIEFGVMKKSLSPTNMRYQDQQYKIQQIKEQLAKLERGDSTQSDSFMNLPVKDTPELALQLARLTRDLKIQETIFELLKQQYEQAKIQELRDTPTIQVLDKPDVPKIKSRPKRVFSSLLAGMLSFSLTLMAVLVLEFVRREKDKDSFAYRGMQGVTNMLNEDYFWLRNLFTRKRKDAN
jgi:tyrosine-protein kinase Etk/Wzc